jgi:uncharacterized protein (TIGR02722 family)
MMKRLIITIIVLALILTMVSCASRPKVSRVEAGTQIDLTGFWNDSDVRIVSESLINDFMNSPRVTQIINEMDRTPVVLVGRFRNESSEHIDTNIISTTMETVIFNTGKLDFVAGGSVREELRDERQAQQLYARDDTTTALSGEVGADFMLFGSVRSIVERVGRHSVRTYFVSAEMTNLETNQRMWMATNNEIKKTVVQRRNRL